MVEKEQLVNGRPRIGSQWKPIFPSASAEIRQEHYEVRGFTRDRRVILEKVSSGGLCGPIRVVNFPIMYEKVTKKK